MQMHLDWVNEMNIIEIDRYDYGSILEDDQLAIYKEYIAASHLDIPQDTKSQSNLWLLNVDGIDYDDVFDIIELAAFDDPITGIYHSNNVDNIVIYTKKNKFVASSPVTENTSELESVKKDALSEADKIFDIANDYELSKLNMDLGSDEKTSDIKAWIRAVYHQVVANADYDGRDEYEWTTHANDMYGCLIEGRTLCVGYAETIKFLLDKKGVPNFIGTGVIQDGTDTRHAFNILEIEGEWLVLDGTMNAYNPQDGGSRVLMPDSLDFRQSYTGCLISLKDYLNANSIDVEMPTMELLNMLNVQL